MDGLGQLDELLSIIKFSEKFPSKTILPSMTESEHHSIQLADAKNPVLGMENDNYVGNDFILEEEKLVFVTGPNSGGKTAFCKTITQVQVLAQAGYASRREIEQWIKDKRLRLNKTIAEMGIKISSSDASASLCRKQISAVFLIRS